MTLDSCYQLDWNGLEQQLRSGFAVTRRPKVRVKALRARLRLTFGLYPADMGELLEAKLETPGVYLSCGVHGGSVHTTETARATQKIKRQLRSGASNTTTTASSSATTAVFDPMRAALLCFPTPCVRQPSPNFNPLPVPPLCRPPHLASAASPKTARLSLLPRRRRRRGRPPGLVASAGTEEAELQPPAGQQQGDATPMTWRTFARSKATCCSGIPAPVLELLKKNRDMLFGEVKLTIMIEDPRDIERKRLLGIEDPDEVTRDDLAAALEDVNEGRIPENRNALRLLAKEMTEWPDLEVEVPKKKSKPNKSLYAKATDTGVDPKMAAKRLNIDWDSAADVESDDEADDIEVPPAVGYGALYLVTALPLVIGISVVLILFYNSLQ
uniref:Protein CHLOROPLAST ENHANCING STRESS TOLERANCE, chloroplastic n=1 Tax=Ananas comosus var. bracteatus TaxID=296719 RepID=A0A6V7PBK6_ANACO|nr:unnamed protein product [Ananas comosus var. bracteatus]